LLGTSQRKLTHPLPCENIPAILERITSGTRDIREEGEEGEEEEEEEEVTEEKVALPFLATTLVSYTIQRLRT